MTVSTKTLIVTVQQSDSDSESHYELNFDSPNTVLDLLNANNIGIHQECGGFGTCTTCQFEITKGLQHFSQRSEIELERASERNFLDNQRLACQSVIFDSASIKFKYSED